MATKGLKRGTRNKFARPIPLSWRHSHPLYYWALIPIGRLC